MVKWCKEGTVHLSHHDVDSAGYFLGVLGDLRGENWSVEGNTDGKIEGKIEGKLKGIIKGIIQGIIEGII